MGYISRRDHSPKCVRYRVIYEPNLYEFIWVFFSVVCGSWFDHFLSWEEHKNDKNILFLFYEDMKKVNMLSVLISECFTFKLT